MSTISVNGLQFEHSEFVVRTNVNSRGYKNALISAMVDEPLCIPENQHAPGVEDPDIGRDK